ncbi:MAG: prolipoprotein diacylglyceryl transferase [Streptococcus sp.]|nr:prolipoprotein diacylglyceryl transferase [Streptococcus sp.]
MIDPVAIQLGSISIRWYAIFIVSGLLLAVYLAMKEAPRRKIIPDDILDFILIAFPLAIIGARVYYVIFDWSYYANQPFVRIRDIGTFPTTKEVLGSNYCDIGIYVDETTQTAILVSVIDNLVKGASGQAIQNLNILYDFEVTTGLNQSPVYP